MRRSAQRMTLESVQTEIDELKDQTAVVERQLAKARENQDKEAMSCGQKRLLKLAKCRTEHIKRLAEQQKYQRELELRLLRAQAAGFHTLKQVFKTPLHCLHAQLSPVQGSSKTEPSIPRTFRDILPWSEFVPGACQLEESLDDVECEYRIPSTTIDPAAGIGPAADEIEVRGVIMNGLYSINEAAKILGIKAEYVGGGNGRSTSFMDWVLRKSGQLSNPEKLSCLVFGAGRVKWEWQLDWKPGETLEAILKDPERRDALLLALQQAYGDAVIDEAPMFIISNYHVTVFLKRSEDVQDKRLWASQPVWWDQEQPSARSCWLWALHEATQMQHLKCKLSRLAVPQTDIGYETPVISKQAQRSNLERLPRRAHPAVGLVSSSTSQTTEEKKRKADTFRHQSHEKPSIILGCPGSTSQKGHELAALTPVSASSQQSPSDLDTRPAQAPAAVPQLGDEPELSHELVGLTDKLLSVDQYGQTMLGQVNNERYAVKLYDNRQPEAIYAYFNEKACLQALGSCSSVVKLKMAGRLQDSLYPCIVTMYAGEPVQRLSAVQCSQANKAIVTLHQAGAAHGDIHLSDLLFDKDSCSCHVADLASCTLNATLQDKSSDLQQWKMLPH